MTHALAQNLKKLRALYHLTVEQMAACYGLDLDLYHGLEEETVDPTISTIVRIAEVLKIWPTRLLQPISEVELSYEETYTGLPTMRFRNLADHEAINLPPLRFLKKDPAP